MMPSTAASTRSMGAFFFEERCFSWVGRSSAPLPAAAAPPPPPPPSSSAEEACFFFDGLSCSRSWAASPAWFVFSFIERDREWSESAPSTRHLGIERGAQRKREGSGDGKQKKKEGGGGGPTKNVVVEVSPPSQCRSRSSSSSLVQIQGVSQKARLHLPRRPHRRGASCSSSCHCFSSSFSSQCPTDAVAPPLRSSPSSFSVFRKAGSL